MNGWTNAKHVAPNDSWAFQRTVAAVGDTANPFEALTHDRRPLGAWGIEAAKQNTVVG